MSTSSTTCATTSTTGTSTTTTSTSEANTAQYIGLIEGFSSIEYRFSSTANGTVISDVTTGYHVTSASGGIYDLNFTSVDSSNGSLLSTFLVQVDGNNNTVLSVSLNFGTPFTMTGATAAAYFDSFMAEVDGGFILGQLDTSVVNNPYFHSTGPTPMTFGSVTFDVTTWSPPTLPFTVSQCGTTYTFTAFTLQVGTPPGTSQSFLTYFNDATSSGAITYQLISMTQA